MSIQVIKQPLQPSLCATSEREPRALSVGCYQMQWYENPKTHYARLAEGVARCAEHGAQLVSLPELTLSRYPADTRPTQAADRAPELLLDGPTMAMASSLAKSCDVFVQASLYEKVESEDGRGLNTAIIVSPAGELVGHTRKLHIPVTEGYFEDHYFAEGPTESPYPVHRLETDSVDLNLGLPTCWDEWFPEVARSYALGGAELLSYPTAIGSEPDHPNFYSQPLWQAVITGHAIANGLFIVVPNRFGCEGLITFYGGSFITDPFGRVLAKAPDDQEAALIVDIDINQREDWLQLFPFFSTRRPDTYGKLTEPRVNPRSNAGAGISGPIPGLDLS